MTVFKFLVVMEKKKQTYYFTHINILTKAF